MSRRRFLQTVGVGLLAAPLAAEAQRTAKVARVGWLSSGPVPSVFVGAMKERGWVEGQTLVIERRYGESNAQLHEFAAELGRLKLDVLVVLSAGLAAIAQREAKDTPIVALSGRDLVRMGLVASLAKPGGKVTGVQDLQGELFGKRLQLLRELVPAISRVAWLQGTVTLDAIPSEDLARDVQLNADAARSLGLELHRFPATRPEDFPALFREMVDKGYRGLLVTANPFTNVHRNQIVDLAARHRIPTMYSFRNWVEAGGLVSYGTKTAATWQRMAALVDKILRGAKPGDLPVEQSTEFELVINLKTAKALGLTIPPSLLQRVDQVID